MKDTKKHKKLKKITVFTQRLSAKTHLIISIISGKSYICNYPDPDDCPRYDRETKLCTDHNVRCSYRTKY